jgi:hypothetical protein
MMRKAHIGGSYMPDTAIAILADTFASADQLHADDGWFRALRELAPELAVALEGEWRARHPDFAAWFVEAASAPGG